MTGFLFTLLGIIIRSILVLLLLLLVLVCLVLFLPFFYRINGSKADNNIILQVRISWLAGVIRLIFDYPEPKAAIIKAAGLTVYRSDRTVKTNSENPESSAASAQPEREPSKTGPGTAAESGKAAEPGKEELQASPSSSDQIPNVASQDQETLSQSPFWAKWKQKLQALIRKLKSLFDRISYYLRLANEEDTRELLQHVLKRAFRILKSIRPRSIKGELLIGTGAPDTTGYCLALYGMLYPYYGQNLKITADFEQKLLEGNLQIKGHITIITVLYHALRVMLDKKLYQFIKKLKKGGRINGR